MTVLLRSLVWCFTLAVADLGQLKDASVRFTLLSKEIKGDTTITSTGHGSGTIFKVVKEQEERYVNYVITGSHLFDGVEEIRIEVFKNGENLGYYPGELLLRTKHKEAGGVDLALVRFVSAMELTSRPIAPGNYQPVVGEEVTHIGCPHGKDPQPFGQPIKVTALNRYLIGSNYDRANDKGIDDAPISNLETNLEAEFGRSGGGLFNKKEEVIGVLTNADPADKESIYMSWLEFVKLLKGTDYRFLLD